MTKTRIFKATLITVAVALAALAGMFATDAYMAGHLRQPIFARPVTLTTGYGEGHDVYKGIGYTVETETYTDENSYKRLIAVTMYVGNKVISASIT